MLIKCKKNADGITIGRLYQFKWYTSNGHSVIVNNRLQLIAYPSEYFNFNYNKPKEVIKDNLLAMLKSKTFFVV